MIVYDNKSIAILNGLQSIFKHDCGYRYNHNSTLPIYQIEHENIKKAVSINIVDGTLGFTCVDNILYKQNHDINLKSSSINVIKSINFDIYNFNKFSTSTLIYDNTIKPKTTEYFFNGVDVLVENYKNPVIGGFESNKDIIGNIKDIKITCQKNSFIEIKVDFDKLQVVSITNLPQGLNFENNHIKGVPKKSGVFDVIFELSDESIWECTFLVPALQRLL